MGLHTRSGVPTTDIKARNLNPQPGSFCASLSPSVKRIGFTSALTFRIFTWTLTTASCPGSLLPIVLAAVSFAPFSCPSTGSLTHFLECWVLRTLWLPEAMWDLGVLTQVFPCAWRISERQPEEMEGKEAEMRREAGEKGNHRVPEEETGVTGTSSFLWAAPQKACLP